ncbi:hypothetical protein WISP_63881 [Willisornis vidua]|uniref:Uncharacterized protein n=1 Tax=Willisornis vidua TaxID=1566151 RepID=A0ABQ9DAA1_9PASS|nr:hypothetical protein WISP_63881 [Willisornis vidua]
MNCVTCEGWQLLSRYIDQPFSKEAGKFKKLDPLNPFISVVRDMHTPVCGPEIPNTVNGNSAGMRSAGAEVVEGLSKGSVMVQLWPAQICTDLLVLAMPCGLLSCKFGSVNQFFHFGGGKPTGKKDISSPCLRR